MFLRLLSCSRRPLSSTQRLLVHSGRYLDFGIQTPVPGRPHFLPSSFSSTSFSRSAASGGDGYSGEGPDDALLYEDVKLPDNKDCAEDGKLSEAIHSGDKTKATFDGIYKAVLIGKVGNEPSQKILRNGSTVTLFTLGTSGMRNNRKPFEDETPEQYARRSLVQWHRIAVYQFRLGALAMKSLKKGSQVYVEGNLETRVFLEPESNAVKRIQEIAVRQNGRVIFLEQNKAKV